MARARNIKPGLFKNEVLGVADPLLTLLFEGLWVLADRAGRLEDRPLRIKAEVFPYRDANVDEMLNWLQANDFLVRYQVCGKRYIEITNFAKHQNPHKNESESEIPAPPGQIPAASVPVHAQELSTSEEIGTTSEEIGSARADSLNSDSLSTDSLSSELRSAGKPAKVTDPDEIIFGYGVPLLVKAGSNEKHARSFLGGLRKHHGDAVLIETLRDCLKAKPLQPLDWLAAVLPPKSTGAPKAAPMSFKERETKAKEARFREMAGAAYGSLPGVANDYIDMEAPNVALISG